MAEPEVDGVAATAPSASVFETIIRYQGLELPAHRILQAVRAYATLAPSVSELRGVKFPFLEGVPEPGTANQWIENGGKSWWTLPS
jgi:hypothetical protein